ncbi:MAG: NAD(P)H-dependent oxidoreductase [Ignavibacteria bacterium]|nr:NAD(P)H-dependent oxidoreductase [Ignavibacteria bacterium]
MKKINIVCLGGSMEQKSSTLAVLKYASASLKELGAEVYVSDIRTLELPVFSYKALRSLRNRKFTELVKKIKNADGFIFASPEYHGSVSSAFKNVIDYLEVLSKETPPYLSLKPVGCIALGGAENAGYATLSAMISIVHNLRGVAAPNSLAIGYGSSLFDNKGNLKSEVIIKRVNRLSDELFLLAKRLKD